MFGSGVRGKGRERDDGWFLAFLEVLLTQEEGISRRSLLRQEEACRSLSRNLLALPILIDPN
jgi:hypothetical protein